MKKAKKAKVAKSKTPFINTQKRWLEDEISYLEKSKDRLVNRQDFEIAASVRKTIKLIEEEIKSLRNCRGAC